MKARDLLPYQIPESFLITRRIYGKTNEFEHIECPVISIRWIRGLKDKNRKPILAANIRVELPLGKSSGTITYALKEGVYTQNAYSIPYDFRFTDYSGMTPAQIEDYQHPTGVQSLYWFKKRAIREIAAKKAKLIEAQERTVMANQVEEILLKFESQQNYTVTWAARNILNLFNEWQASDDITAMVMRLNQVYVDPEEDMDMVMGELESIGVYYDEQPKAGWPKAGWDYLPYGKWKNDE